jgi:uncharacterized protein
MKIFFASDIHGSELCWRKFLNAAAFYKADVLVLGGDVTGKVMVPVVVRTGYHEVSHEGQLYRVETGEELAEIERDIRKRGWYPVRVTPDELAELSSEDAVDRRFTTEMLSTLDRWLDMADGKLRGGTVPCIVNGGNDDLLAIDAVLEKAPSVIFAEGKVVELDGFHIASMGYTNPTPWDTFREAPEADLARRIADAVRDIPDMERAIFNFHAPPHGSGLDEAPDLDQDFKPRGGGTMMKAVGSTAVRDAILEHQPLVSLHGHIHEGRGVARLGRTPVINPGSIYTDGALQGVVVDLNSKKAKLNRSMLVTG